jgi:alkylhydroperoxidase family enzyme
MSSVLLVSTDPRPPQAVRYLWRHASDAMTAFEAIRAARVGGVDELLADPRVNAFAEQFAVDVSVISEEQRAAVMEACGASVFAVVQRIWVDDMTPRLRSAAEALFGGGGTWHEPDRVEVTDTWPLVDAFLVEVARLKALDPRLTELVRLRGARQHDCQVCKSRRSADAIKAGADDAEFAAVDDYATSDLPDIAKAALALVDAMIWTPTAIPDDVVADVRRHLTEAQAVEVVLDVVRNAANKIAVALRADAADVTEGVQLFTTDADGILTVVAG